MGKSKKKKKSSSNKNNIPYAQNSAAVQTNRKKTDYDIPTISFKSGLIIMLGATIATLVVPYILSLIGISFNMGIIIGNALITPYAVAYTRYFVETNRGYSKGFYRTYIMFSVSFAIIGYFWLYLGTYV